ncbi:hypothetical protein [Acinetobacter baumannii]|uniref:hypothetical protein n=1 Tax=Acinetobacter baumannii TaxID=470 RepID=UPI0023404ADA|nr:hypothetical protein [Acinetobacter baumannii]MDC4110405.1 hypothetical protein [Acinetobacter baumannii]
MALKRQIETGIKLNGIDKASRIHSKILTPDEQPIKHEFMRETITDIEVIQPTQH